MSKRSLGRIAALAAVTLVGAMLPAVILAGPASAAAPTVLAVTPTTQTVAGGVGAGTADYTVGFNNELGVGSIYYAVASGPDGASAPFSAGVLCPENVTDSTCTVDFNGTPGTDNLVFFYSPTTTATAQFTAGAPQISGTLIVTDVVNSITAAPTSAAVAQGQWSQYTLTATDVNGNAIPGQVIDISATQANQDIATGVLQLVDADPLNAFTGLSPPGTGTLTATLQVTTDSTGSVPFWANSTGAGTVNFTFDPNPVVLGIQGAASLTVDPGTANDVTQVVIDPATQTAFQGATVASIVTVLNSEGDVVGDPAALPTVSITAGPNVGQPVTVTDLNLAVPAQPKGTYRAEYTALPPSTTETTTGTDTLQAFVNHTPGTAALDAGEPVGTSTITVVGRPDGINLVQIGPDPAAAFTNSTSAALIFELTDGAGNPLSGYGVNVAVDTAASAPASQVSGYSVSPTLAFTGADGRFVATVTNANPLVGDSVVVNATLVGDSAITEPATVNWEAPADVVTIAPAPNTETIGGSATFTVTTVNPVGTAVGGVNYVWTVTSGTTVINGVGDSFTYTDQGSATTDHSELVFVTAFQNGAILGGDATTQYWVRDGVADQVNIDLDSFGGEYVGQGVNNTLPPFAPTGFVNTITAGIIADPTPTNPVTGSISVGAKLADSNNNRLFGETVTFTSSGVGSFTDADGNALPGNSVTAVVDDGSLGGPVGFASVNVRSSVAGVQTITATVNGISSVGTVTWSGQFVPVTPVRVFDTRTGQGGVGTDPLSPNSLEFFDYANTALPLNASAYVFNVTAVDPTDVGNLRIADACDPGGSATRVSTVPDTSLIGYQVDETVANSIVLPSNCFFGGMRVYSDNSPVDVVVDFQGYYLGDQGFQGTEPIRIADTRVPLNTGGATSVADGATVPIQISGLAGIPLDAKAVAVNLTAINPDDLGNLRVFPSGAAVPTTSNINYIPTVDKAAFAVIEIPADGIINVFSDGANVGLAVDVFGYYPADSNVVTSAPVRVFDSRNGSSLPANTPVDIQVAGAAGVPADAQAVLVSVTGIHNAASTGVGNLRIFPASAAVPFVSNLNYVSATSDVANFAIVKLGTDGMLTLYSDGSPIDAAVDVLGYVPAGS